MKRKTTWGKYDETSPWVMLEDRVPLEQVMLFEEDWYRIMNIIQPSRTDPSETDPGESICWMACSLISGDRVEKIDKDYDPFKDPTDSSKYYANEYQAGRVRPMPGKRRKELEENIREIKKEDAQLRATTKNERVPWYMSMLCLLLYTATNWFYSDSPVVDGIDYYEHNQSVYISEYLLQNHEQLPAGFMIGAPADTRQVVTVYAGDRGYPSNSTEFVKEVVDLAYDGYQVAFLTEQWSESSFRSDLLLSNNTSMSCIDGSGNISCCCTERLRDVIQQWLNEHRLRPTIFSEISSETYYN